MPNHIDVVIPVHNSVHWLSWCLEELFKFQSDRLRSIYVVNDRSSSDQSQKLKEIISRFDNVEFLENLENIGGFGYACNLGAASCTSSIILFLNTDCLLTEGVLDRLCAVFDDDQSIALACPVSNNSPDLTYPMLPGHSYRDMASIFAQASKLPDKNLVLEACTVVGNCLAVRRDFYEQVGGFSSEWGIGYGEETDLHMKALSMGLKGVVHVGCYVYHFGGGTFNFQSEIEEHKKKNHQIFMGKWGKEYKNLAARCGKINPLDIISKEIDREFKGASKIIELDVLFFLPGIDQGIGGIHAVISICNELIRQGFKASCALVGISADKGLKDYKEPVLFNFLYYISENAFLEDRIVCPKIVFSSIFYSAPIVAKFAERRQALAIQFIQGYEGYFENGQQYVAASESYKSTDHVVVTSNWLANKIGRHLQNNQHLENLPLIINEDIFFSGEGDRPIDVCMIFRASADKGQWLLAEILDHLVNQGLRITILYSKPYHDLKAKYSDRVQFIDLPLPQYSLAKILRQVKVFVDCSLHEGFGLMPLEAALCGCAVVASDSGGVRDFSSIFDIELLSSSPDPDSHLDAIYRKLKTYQVKQQTWVDHHGGINWHQYIDAHCKKVDSTRPNLDEIFKVELVELKPVVLSIQKQGHLRDTLAGIYRRCRPYIPLRLHLALKVLLVGHL